MDKSYEIPFAGLTGETGPLTWGQRHIWTIQNAHPHNRAQFHLSQQWRVPPGTAERDVLAALGRLVERHQALRTRLPDSPGGLIQQVHGDGAFAVRAQEVASGELSEHDLHRLAGELMGGDFVWDEEFLARFTILTVRGAPVWVLVAASHMIADGAACSILAREFLVLLEEPSALPPPTGQPVGWAAGERSRRGAETSARSAAYMRDVLRKHPRRLFGASGGGGAVPPVGAPGGFPVVLGHGPNLGEHVRGLAARWRTSEAAVVLTALARSCAAHTGVDSFPLGVTCSNRQLPGAAGYVGMLAQNSVIGVDVSSGTPARTAAQLRRSLLAASAHAVFDQDELGEVLAEAGVDDDYLGFGAVGHFVNYMPLDRDPEAERRIGSASIRIEEGDPADYRIPRFGVVFHATADHLGVRMFADPAVIPADLARSVTRSCLEALQSFD
ncbi:condensation domain-containing protein [Nonomuraea sp. NPDC050404]|uniref:condensation domain-containing protein n=1 Tax=Nonomuraea sp. NPDC050404 TaxID=3155783 RepID=UPI0033C10EE8